MSQKASPAPLPEPAGYARPHQAAGASAGLTLWDRVLAWRHRLVADARFQRWASAFPLTRGVAHHNARRLFDLCAGFVYSQVLLACVRLKVMEAVADVPQTAEALAPRFALPVEATERLLNAAVGIGLLSRRSGARYGLADLGAAMLGNPGVAAMVEHHAILYGDLHDPVALLRAEDRQTRLAHYWPYAQGRGSATMAGDDVAAYSQLMAASQPMIAEEVVDAHRFAQHRRLLDIGGGTGTFARAVAATAPALAITVFDLPQVAALGAQGASGPCISFVGGNFFSDPLPIGADAASLIRVLFDHDDEGALAILRAVRATLPPGGTLIVAEPMAGDGDADRTGTPDAIGDAYFSFYLLAMGRGRTRRPDQIAALLQAAGFSRVQTLRNRRPMLTRVIRAHVAEG